MSVLIKGMEMPKHGAVCLIVANYDDWESPVAMLVGRESILPKAYYDAIEVPTPHGRLIDADNVSSDAVCSHCVEEYCRNNCECFIENVQTILSNELITPTIIEAEVSENGCI